MESLPIKFVNPFINLSFFPLQFYSESVSHVSTELCIRKTFSDQSYGATNMRLLTYIPLPVKEYALCNFGGFFIYCFCMGSFKKLIVVF